MVSPTAKFDPKTVSNQTFVSPNAGHYKDKFDS